MRPYALITGASSGIGEEFAKELARDYDLILVARRKDRLEDLAKSLDTKSIILAHDLSSEEECYELFEEIQDLDIRLFINNAGFGETGSFFETPIKKELQMLDVNIKALYILLKLMIPKMDVNGGYILNVASTAGLMPAGPYMAQYYATKSYVVSLTRALYQELKEKKSPLHISALCPGPVDTEFNKVANAKFSLKGITVEKCCKYTLKQMYKNKLIIVPGFGMRSVARFSYLMPKKMLVKMTGKQQKKKIY